MPIHEVHAFHFAKKTLKGGNIFANLNEGPYYLRQLKGIYVVGNYLSELPESIANLTELIILDLRHNKLRDLPLFVISSLKNLRNPMYENDDGFYLDRSSFSNDFSFPNKDLKNKELLTHLIPVQLTTKQE